jgi:hypothetical protein
MRDIGHMHPVHRRTLLAALTGAPLLAVGSVGCAGRTTIEHYWRSPGWSGAFTHVAIFGVSRLAGVRRDFETRMAAALAGAGVKATPSHVLLRDRGELPDVEESTPSPSDPSPARVLAEHGIDGALVTRLVGVDRDLRYVDGIPYAAVGGVRPGFYGPGFYDYYYGMAYSPGYTVDYAIVTLETNLYDVASLELVWAGLSETFDPKNVTQAIESYAKVMTNVLIRIGLLTPTFTPW